MKVYVITSGEYSDYRICAIALDKEKAEHLKKRCDHFDYTGARIEEYETDDYDFMLNGDVYKVIFDKSGDVKTIGKADLNSYTLELCKEKPFMRCGGLNVFVTSKDADTAIKIAAERRAKFLAEEIGL